MNPKDFLDRCEEADDKACHNGTAFALRYETMEQVWDSCKRVDWLIWILARLGGYDRELRLFACDCAERALSRSANPDPRSFNAVRVARLFADGLATEDELGMARSAAWAAEASEASRSAARSASGSAAAASSWAVARPAERKAQLDWLKVLIANPFTKKDIT